MEFFKTNTKIESKRETKLKRSIENATRKVSLALKTVLSSAIITFSFPNENLSAQNLSSIHSRPKNEIDWKSNIGEVEKKNIEETIISQKDWLVEYTKSKKYTERLSKEFLRWRELGGENGELTYELITENPIFKTYKVDEKGDTLMIINHLQKTTQASGEYQMPEDEFEKIVSEKKVLEKFLPDPDINSMSPDEKLMIALRQESRAEKIKNSKVIVVDKIGNSHTTIGQFNILKPKKIMLRADFAKHDSATPAHEFTHLSTVGNIEMGSATFYLLQNRAASGSEYLNDPTEIHARLNELRVLLGEEGIYDAKNEDFTEKHYDNLLKNKIIKNSGIEQLLDTLEKEDLIWFMNNVAGTNIVALEIKNTA